MSRSAKPRKRYRAAPVHLNAASMALDRVRKLAIADVQQQRHIVATALREFSAGKHCAHHWRSLADVGNMAETLVTMGICSGQQAEGVVHNAQAALAAVQQRHAGGGSWTLYPAELDALHWLAALHANQLAECDYSEFERAWRQTHQRVAQARAGNAPRGAIVIEGDIAARQGVAA